MTLFGRYCRSCNLGFAATQIVCHGCGKEQPLVDTLKLLEKMGAELQEKKTTEEDEDDGDDRAGE